MIRWALPALLIATLLVSPLFAGSAAAANVDVTLIAENILFRVGTTSEPTITVQPGDVIRFRIENRDSFAHTFTFPHFEVDRQDLLAGAIIFENITTLEADRGKWQFYCAVPGHATGPDENRDGMVGYVQVGTPPQPSPIGLEIILIIVAIVVVVAVVVIVMRRRKGAA